MRFSVIGCGRVGINLAVRLAGAGYEPHGFFSRSTASAEKARMAVKGAGLVFSDSADACRDAGLVFLSTPDNTIEPVCRSIADKDGFSENSTVFHLSGALSSQILAAAAERGAATGSIHPLQSFTPYKEGQASPFAGVNISVEGSSKAVSTGKTIVSALGGNDFTLPTEAKMLYHAAAVVASNYLVTLENFALTLLGKAGLEEKQAFSILAPLIEGTLNNIRNTGAVNALTGPVARGDTGIVASHIRDLEEKAPDFAPLYKILGQYTLRLAKERGEIGKETADEMAVLLGG